MKVESAKGRIRLEISALLDALESNVLPEDKQNEFKGRIKAYKKCLDWLS